MFRSDRQSWTVKRHPGTGRSEHVTDRNSALSGDLFTWRSWDANVGNSSLAARTVPCDARCPGTPAHHRLRYEVGRSPTPLKGSRSSKRLHVGFPLRCLSSYSLASCAALRLLRQLFILGLTKMPVRTMIDLDVRRLIVDPGRLHLCPWTVLGLRLMRRQSIVGGFFPSIPFDWATIRRNCSSNFCRFFGFLAFLVGFLDFCLTLPGPSTSTQKLLCSRGTDEVKERSIASGEPRPFDCSRPIGSSSRPSAAVIRMSNLVPEEGLSCSSALRPGCARRAVDTNAVMTLGKGLSGGAVLVYCGDTAWKVSALRRTNFYLQKTPFVVQRIVTPQRFSNSSR